MIKVSIVTVVYNNKGTIADAINSVLGQDYHNIEYIVIDGGSKDGTCNIIESYSNSISKYISEPDKGIYDAMNKGVKMATGDIVGILNSDDFYATNHVISDMVKLAQETKADAIYADLDYVDADNTNAIKRKWRSGKYKKNAFLWGWMPPHPTFFVKRAIYDQYGLFNTILRSAADYELMLRFIHKHQIDIAYLPKVVVKMREGGASNASLKNRIKANNEDRKAWELNGIKPYFFTMWLKPFRKIIQFI